MSQSGREESGATFSTNRLVREFDRNRSNAIRYEQQQGGAASVTRRQTYGVVSAAYTIALK